MVPDSLYDSTERKNAATRKQAAKQSDTDIKKRI